MENELANFFNWFKVERLKFNWKYPELDKYVTSKQIVELYLKEPKNYIVSCPQCYSIDIKANLTKSNGKCVCGHIFELT